MARRFLFKNTSGRVKTIWVACALAWCAQHFPVYAQASPSQAASGSASLASVRINELFPRAQTDIPEWFELVNVSPDPVAVQKWRYGKASDTADLTRDSITVQPNRFLVVTKDKAAFARKYPSVSCVIQPAIWITLDNYRDTLQLWDANGAQREAIAYQSDWFDHWTDQSLERVSLQQNGMLRDAWVAAGKPTPGQPNASVSFRAVQKPSIEISPVPFTPNGDGKDDLFSITLFLPAAYTAAISVYGFNGKKYIDLPITPLPHYQWDGKMENGLAAPIGPFFVVATFKNGDQSIMQRKKGILWR